MSELKLSVVVPCYGRSDLTRRLLASLAASPNTVHLRPFPDGGLRA
jgi:hypothetical protein